MWWLIPAGYALGFVAAWPGVLEPDDGSGLPWIGPFALGLPWSLGATVVIPHDGASVGLQLGLAVSGAVNLVLAVLFVARRSRRVGSS
jgi:hypothetical protein